MPHDLNSLRFKGLETVKQGSHENGLLKSEAWFVFILNMVTPNDIILFFII